MLFNCQRADENIVVDRRDNSEYTSIRFNGEEWTAQNLMYIDNEIYNSGAWVWGDKNHGLEAAKNRLLNGKGVLYDWECSKKYCPEGWSLPSKDDWDKLIEHYSDNSSGSPDFYGFNLAFDGRARTMGKFCLFDGDTFWTKDSCSNDPNKAISVAIRISSEGDIICSYEDAEPGNGYYVRCIRNKNTQ